VIFLVTERKKDMSDRVCGIILCAIGIIVSAYSGDSGGFWFCAILASPFVFPSKLELQAIIKKIHKQHNRARTYHYKPAIF
jgi:hypothetical protein